MKKPNSFQIAKVQPQDVAGSYLTFPHFSLALLIKVLLIQKVCIQA